ncbi:MAG: hypothetical protein OWQ51_01815 [Pyrobaculum arsenaticum]|uniref:hypothetical protein n=1 Tax=Pyrobaculum arsenaticum TaxID=121277 RepID=UPI000FFB932D|nr:hypothetical protein [Pyrobaculum arsenaticum]MCY0889713.1 hypothetical protein [Pyrobaculum arsenaticum]
MPTDEFIQFLYLHKQVVDEIGGPTPGFSLIAALLSTLGLGGAFAISPCVVLPLALATTRKWIIYFIGGGLLGYAVWSATLALFRLPISLGKSLTVVLIIILGVMYLIGVKGPFWRVQTFFYK